LDARGNRSMEAQLPQVFERILLHDKRSFRRGQPVIEPGQEEAQGGSPAEDGQRVPLLPRKRADRVIAFQKRHALREVVGAVLLEAPGIKADNDVIDEHIVACKIEIDQTGQLVSEEEDIVLKEISVDDTERQVAGPA